VGLETLKRIGDRVEKNEPLARLHLASDDAGAVARAAGCFTIGDQAPRKPDLVLERVD
jgi:thymidine phosphorylase